MQELTRRNTETVEQVIKDMYAKLYSQAEMISQLNSGIGTLQERMGALEQQLIIQRVQLCGLGPSVKE